MMLRRPSPQTLAFLCCHRSPIISSVSLSSILITPPSRQFSTGTAAQLEHEKSSTSNNARQVIFSGIQPTGVPHLGNYLGALRQWVKATETYPSSTKQFYCIVDLHAITQYKEPEDLRMWKLDTIATLLAIGLKEDAIIFEQSQVPAHSELMWILSCIAPMGGLNRMTQWKTKLDAKEDQSEKDVPSLRLGLFSYPVLQAADILVHRATHVPVGADQCQHLELTRDIVSSFNFLYGNIFPLPQTVLSPAKRIMSLRDPTQKMSKSDPDIRSRILLTDSPETIRSKIKHAVTDSIMSGIHYDPEERPGVSNLLDIYAHIEGKEQDMKAVANEFKGLRLVEMKAIITESIINALSPIRTKFDEIVNEGELYLDEVCRQGARKARESAEETLDIVKKAVGLR